MATRKRSVVEKKPLKKKTGFSLIALDFDSVEQALAAGKHAAETSGLTVTVCDADGLPLATFHGKVTKH